MRTINLNGYIDEDVWYGDEITPAMLHDVLYGENSEFSDDVRIILNSYGGSCNAAVRMHDDIRAYPGRVHLVISGTAASAATVLSAAADTLEMTPGSLYMIHDPSTVAWGNERDFGEAIALLKACKESILNIYSRRSPMRHSAAWGFLHIIIGGSRHDHLYSQGQEIRGGFHLRARTARDGTRSENVCPNRSAV